MFLWCALWAVPLCAAERPFVVAINDAAVELHPQRSFTVTEAQIFTAMYEGLVNYNPRTLQAEAAVAERWSVSDDGRVYTFYLRESARYWNGDAVVAAHFKDAWMAALSPQGDSYFSVLFDVIEGAAAYRNGLVDSAEVGIAVIDQQTLQVTLAAPTPFFLSTLCHYSFAPIHPRMQQVADWNTSELLLSNGPYVLKEVTGEALVLMQSDTYWDYNESNFEALHYVFIDQEEDAFARFASGEIDWVMSGFGESVARYGSALQVNPILGTNFYFFMADKKPWNDASVRRALALLVPWDEVRSREHYTFPSASLVPAIPGYTQQEGIQEADATEAMRLLEKSGYSDGDGLPTLVIAVPDSVEDRRVAQIMAQAWREALDVEVTINSVPGAEYFEFVELDGDYTIGRISWIGDYVDPLAFLQLWGSDSNLNHARYRDTEYDNLLWRAMEEEGAERMTSLRMAEGIIIDGALVLPVNHSVAINAVDTERIAGWYTNVLDIHPVKDITFQVNFLQPNVAHAGE